MQIFTRPKMLDQTILVTTFDPHKSINTQTHTEQQANHTTEDKQYLYMYIFHHIHYMAKSMWAWLCLHAVVLTFSLCWD